MLVSHFWRLQTRHSVSLIIEITLMTEWIHFSIQSSGQQYSHYDMFT